MKSFTYTTYRSVLSFIIIGVFLILDFAHAQKNMAKFTITRIGYKINAGKMQWAKPDTIIDFSPGDKLSLDRLEFKSSSSSGSTWAEAYYHDGKTPGEAGINYKNGQFTTGRRLSSGRINSLSFKRGSWTLESTYDRFIVVLVHQYGAGDKDFRKVNTANVNVRVKEPKK